MSLGDSCSVYSEDSNLVEELVVYFDKTHILL